MQEFFVVNIYLLEKMAVSRIGGHSHLVSLGWSHNSSTRTGGRSSSEVGSLEIEKMIFALIRYQHTRHLQHYQANMLTLFLEKLKFPHFRCHRFSPKNILKSGNLKLKKSFWLFSPSSRISKGWIP